jgi:hypothetical protein
MVNLILGWHFSAVSGDLEFLGETGRESRGS